MVPARSGLVPDSGQTVTVVVGLLAADAGQLPILDAVFDPGDASIVYVVPVLVTSSQEVGNPYYATAKLQLTPQAMEPYDLLAVYGAPEVPGSDVKKQRLREIEIDKDGRFLFVTSAYTASPTLLNNDYLLIYDEAAPGSEVCVSTGEVCLATPTVCPVQLHRLSEPIHSPTGLKVSANQDRLYLAGTVNELSGNITRIFRFDIDRDGSNNVTGISSQVMVDITNPLTDGDEQTYPPSCGFSCCGESL